MLPERRPSDVTNLLQYCVSLAREFESRRNRVRNFVQHNFTSGTANEAILRDFLSGISGGGFAVTDGFICNPLQGSVSRQCDILVRDNRFPLVFGESGVTIVWPESVLLMMEVKTAIKSTEMLRAATENIISAKEVSLHAIGLIFAFESLSAESALQVLEGLTCEPYLRPFALVLFDQGVVIQQAGGMEAIRYGGGDAPYEIRRSRDQDPSALALTYLLLIFLHALLSRSPGFSSNEDVYSAFRQFLSDHLQVATHP